MLYLQLTSRNLKGYIFAVRDAKLEDAGFLLAENWFYRKTGSLPFVFLMLVLFSQCFNHKRDNFDVIIC